jgi:hypothetical protein
MKASWRYARSRHQPLAVENEYRRRLAIIQPNGFVARVFIHAKRIRADFPDRINDSRQQGITCYCRPGTFQAAIPVVSGETE